MNSYSLDKDHINKVLDVLVSEKGEGCGYIGTMDIGNSFFRIYIQMKDKIKNKVIWWSGIEFHEDAIRLGFMIDRLKIDEETELLKDIKAKFNDFNGIEISLYKNNYPGRRDRYIRGHKKLKDIIGDETNADEQKAKISEFFKEVIDRIKTII